MRKICVRRWAVSAVTVALMWGLVSPVRAVVLPPGGCVGLVGTTLALRAELAGVSLLDNLIPFTILDSAGNPCYRGVVQDSVLRSDLTGALHFYFRIRDTDPHLPCCIVQVARTDFTNQVTDVDYRLDGLGTIGSPLACRSAAGDEVDFYFDPCIRAGSDSLYHFVITRALAFDPVGGYLTITTDDGSSVTLLVAGPL
jgi:hypothetical protein